MMLNNYGNKLKNIGTQLQNMGTEIQKIGMQNIITNQNQLQAIGMQISNMGLQLFKYGVQISNLLFNMQQINMNMQNQMQIMYQQMNQTMNNNSNNEENCICDDPNFIRIIFDYFGKRKLVIANKDLTIEEIFNKYLKEQNLDKNLICFLYNAKALKYDSKTKIKEIFPITNLAFITVYEYNRI